MVRDSKQTLSVANASAFTLQYIGAEVGTFTAAVGSNTLTIVRKDINGLVLGIKGTATIATAAIATDTLTLARAAIVGLNLTYTGDLVATVAVDTSANTLTLTIDGTPTVHDLTDAAKNSLTKIAAILDAVDDITCTVATGADGACASEKLDTLTAFTLVKDTAKGLTYTPADATFDLTNALYNTLAKLQVVLDALPEISCTLATGAIGTQDSATLNDKTATSIKTGYTWLYSNTDATYDLTHTDRNLLSELIAELDAVVDLACTAVTTHTGNASIQLVDFTAANIASALTLSMNHAKFSATWNDIGEPIGVKGWDSLALYVKVDINDTQNARIKFLAKTEVADTDLFLMDHNRVKCPSATVPATEDYIELDSDADQSVEILIPDLYGIEAVQVQISAGTAGASPGAITSIEYIRTKEG